MHDVGRHDSGIFGSVTRQPLERACDFLAIFDWYGTLKHRGGHEESVIGECVVGREGDVGSREND